MDKSDYYTYDEDEGFHVEDSDWNDWTYLCGTEGELSCDLEFVFDIQRSEIISVDRKS